MSSNPKRMEMMGLLGVGAVMVCLAVFFDPFGDDPDTGVIDLTRTQARALLALFGAAFVAGGGLLYLRSRRRAPRGELRPPAD